MAVTKRTIHNPENVAFVKENWEIFSKNIMNTKYAWVKNEPGMPEFMKEAKQKLKGRANITSSQVWEPLIKIARHLHFNERWSPE